MSSQVALLPRPERGEPAPLVLYHGKCPDGFAAALAAWIFFERQAEFLALEHGEVKTLADLPSLAGRVVYILDFSFGPELLGAIDGVAAKLILLDHHKSAADKLQDLTLSRGVLHFDMAKSGARLAWEYFLPERPLPDLVRFVEDRDIWVWQYPQSKAFLAALDMEPFDFERWHTLAYTADVAVFLARGQAMDEKFSKMAADIAQQAEPLLFNGERGLMVNAPGMFHSLVGDLLSSRSGTFALMWSAAQGGVIKAGLRSQRGYNCIPLAESMGGGGHAQACGFRLPVQHLPALLSGVLNAQT